jgi:hypothetical protein
MRFLLIIGMALLVEGCKCISVDCAFEVNLEIKLINKVTRQDLVYDLDIPLSEFIFIRGNDGTILNVGKEDNPERLIVSVGSLEGSYKLKHNSNEYEFSIAGEILNGECCSEYRIINVTSTIPISKEEIFENSSVQYIYTLELD